MRRYEIELYAMKRGLSARQAEQFAENVLSRNNRTYHQSDIEILLVPFAAALGITLVGAMVIDSALMGIPSTAVGVAADVAIIGAEVGVEVLGSAIGLGCDVVGGLFDLF